MRRRRKYQQALRRIDKLERELNIAGRGEREQFSWRTESQLANALLARGLFLSGESGRVKQEIERTLFFGTQPEVAA